MSDSEGRWGKLIRPVPSLILGALFFPIAKLLWIPNYIFNFLTTLVHECGHALAAWIVGRPAIPTVSVAGGGVTPWGQQVLVLCLVIWASLAGLAAMSRRRKPLLIFWAALFLVYPALAFTSANEIFPMAGGILLEIVGAAICFFVVLAVDLERPFERPLYALWGWWMLLNRGAETLLLMRNPHQWNEQAVIQSGLAAGLTSDLEQIRETWNVYPSTILGLVLFLCVAALPAAVGAAFIARRLRTPS